MSLKSIPTVFLKTMLYVTVEINRLLYLFALTWYHHLHQHSSQCEKAVLIAFCSHFALLWLVTSSAAVVGMDGRRMQFCSLIFHLEVIKGHCSDRTTVRPVSLNSFLKLMLPRTREWDGKAPTVFCQSCVWPGFILLRYRFIPQINHISSLFSGPLHVLLSFLSTLLFYMVSFWEPDKGWEECDICIMLNLHSMSSWGWKNFHYPSAVYSQRHLAEKLWYHPEG